MASIFTRIVQGEIPCYKIAEDEQHLAFLDINPLTPGHCLVIPKQEVDYLFDLAPEAMAALALFAQQVAKAVGHSVPCTRVGVLVLGFDVPHAHIHLVPLQSEADIDLKRPRLKLDKTAFEALAQRIAHAMATPDKP